jgi:hypothetical protein
MSNSQRPRRQPGQTVACGWCGKPISVRPTGRLPKWCSASCRHRAWEQRRAFTSDRGPVEVVDRVVRVEVEKPVRVVERVTVEAMPSGRRWVEHMQVLVTQLQAGRVYDRDLLELARVLDVVSQAIQERPGWKRLLRRGARAEPEVSSYRRR